jgi:hypothetical protein
MRDAGFLQRKLTTEPYFAKIGERQGLPAIGHMAHIDTSHHIEQLASDMRKAP